METYIRKEDTWDTTPSVDPLLVAFFLIGTTLQTPVMAGHRVLVRLNAALV